MTILLFSVWPLEPGGTIHGIHREAWLEERGKRWVILPAGAVTARSSAWRGDRCGAKAVLIRAIPAAGCPRRAGMEAGIKWTCVTPEQRLDSPLGAIFISQTKHHRRGNEVAAGNLLELPSLMPRTRLVRL
jgi:hypothetical protein